MKKESKKRFLRKVGFTRPEVEWLAEQSLTSRHAADIMVRYYHQRPKIKWAIHWVALMVFVLAVLFAIKANAEPARPAVRCQPGTYEQGEPGEGICRKEPTGCPYGDSVPNDSEHCVPPPANVPPATQTDVSQNIQAEEATGDWGK